jgi:hypothetical protein
MSLDKNNKINKNLLILIAVLFAQLVLVHTSTAYPTEIYYNESTGSSSIANTGYTEKVSLRITLSTTANYTVIATAEVNHSATTSYVAAALNIDGTIYQEVIYEPKDTTDQYIFAALKRIELNTTQHNISIRYNSTSGTSWMRNARLLVLKIDAKYNESEAISSVTGTTETEKGRLVFTPSTTGDYLIIATANLQSSATGSAAFSNLYVDGTQELGCRMDMQDATNYYTCAVIKNISLSASQHVINLTFYHEDGAQTAYIKYVHIAAIRMNEFYNSYYNASEAETDPAAQDTWYNKTLNNYTSSSGRHLILASAEVQASTSNSNKVRLLNDTTISHDTSIEASATADWFPELFMTVSNLTAGSHLDRLVWFGEGSVANFGIRRARLTSLQLEDIISPTLILGNPVSNTWSNSSSVIFYFTPNDSESGIKNCTLVINGTNNQTNTSVIIEDRENNITTVLNDGIYNWTVTCFDDSVNNNRVTNSSLKIINVDTTKPNIILNAPANSTNTTNTWMLFNFTTTDNLAATTNCTLYINNSANATNSSTANNTATTFNITNIAHGTYQWYVNCTDRANNTNISATRQFFVNQTPILTSVSDSPDPIKGGPENFITITASGVDDPNSDMLYFYCSEISSTPTSTNKNCTGGIIEDSSPPYSLTCTYPPPADDTMHTVYCRVFDGTYYSSVVSTTYTTDSTPPITSVVSVAGDTALTYYDNVNDGKTDMIISGEANMVCRYSTSDDVYSSMSNDCTITDTQANCSATTTTQGLDTYNFYISCQDSLGNAQNTTQNLDIIALVTDWTAPTTSDNSSTTVAVPPYAVRITESDNLPYSTALIKTKYCTDTSGSCSPITSTDDIESNGETIVTFTSSNRGINFLRYNSSDPAGNVQTIQNKTININQLPVFTSASDNATTIKGGSGVEITTISSDADSGQTLKLYVCNSTSANSSGCVHTTYCSNATATANASCSFASEIDDTTHTWYAFLYDSLNESATANHSGTYTTDSSVPTITIVYPGNTTYTQTSVDAAVILSEAANWAGYCLDACTSNTSLTQVTSTYWSKTITDLSNGAHYIIFYTNDSYGNMGNSTTRYFSVDTTLSDTTPPQITVTSPTNNSNHSTTSVWINITTDENLAWAGYSLNETAVQDMSGSLKNWHVQLANLGNAYHNVTVYANDTSTNKNQANKSISFYVDTQAPTYSLVNVTPNPANVSQSVSCSAYWTDNFAIASGKVAENSSGSFVNHTALSNGWTNHTISGADLSLGGFRCIFYVADYAGNENSTSTDFTIQDVLAPTITINSPVNLTYSQNWISASITLSEAGKWANYSLDGAANVSMSNTSLTIWAATVSNIPNGAHTLYFYVADYSDNIGTNSIIFSIDTNLLDTTPPSITILSPTNGTYYGSSSVWANITTSENVSWAGYSLDNGSNVTMDNSSRTSWNKQIIGLSNGIHDISFYANDTNGNMGNSSPRYFYVDIQAPTYVVYNATPYVANQSQSVTCYAQWNDNVNLASGKVAENSSGSFINHTVTISDMSGWTNYTIPANDLSVGGFICIFYATDSANNANTTNISFSVQDIVAPTITINSPTNTTFNQNWISASITLSEAGKWANYSLDGAANVSMSNTSLTIWNATISGILNAVHTLQFYVSDNYNNIGTNSITFTIDTTVFDNTPPTITVWSPTNGTYYTSTSVLLNITLNENASSTVYSLDRAANTSLGNVSLINWNKTITISDGLHNITFYANDTSTNKNTGNSSTIYFTVDTRAPQNVTQGPSSSNDTINITCYAQWSDNIALDYGYLEHNATGTATNSSQISLSGTSGWTNITIASSDTNPGIIQCKAYAYDKAGLANSTSWFVNVTDATNPVLENISYLPNTTDDLDPNVMINITANASDNIALDKIIIQYRQSNSSTWIERAMFSIGGTGYKGNFTPTSEGNWTFRIYANDTSNNTNISSTTEINVSLDYTWINITTIPTTKSIVQSQPRVFGLGNLTINNTADYDLNFTITSNRNWITFNGTNTSLLFIVNSTYNSTRFNVTANTTGFAVGEYTYTITINAYTINPTLISSQTLSGTVVIQNVAGPYLIVSINTYDATVTQGNSGISLSASVENVGTADATNTWLAWTLPSGWSNTSGVLNKSIGFLGVGSTVTNNLAVDISTSATTGSQTLQASAGCAESVTGSDSKNVTVNTLTTTTTSTPSSGTVGGVAGVSTGALIEKILSGEEILSSSETFELVRGYSNSFPVIVKNIFERTTLYNVSIKIEGLLSQYMSFSPSMIDKITFDEAKQFNVTIKSPEYMEKGEHELSIIVTGKIVGAAVRKDLTDTRNVKLIIHAVSEEVATVSLERAMADISEMTKAGFLVTKISKLLEEAKKALAEHQYDDAKDLSEKIKEDKETAFQIYKIIQEIKNKIKTYGSITGLLNKSTPITGAFLGLPNRFTETENTLNLAQAAFEREDFATALQRAKDAQMTFALERGEFNPIFFLIDYWWAILVSMTILSVSGFFGYQSYQKATITQKIINLKKEEDTVRKLMMETQKKHFTEKTIGVETFNKIMSQFQKRISKISQLRVKLRHKRTRLLKSHDVIKDLDGEREEILTLLKELQKNYFVKGKVSRTAYNDQIKVYNERLAEIEDEQLTLETKMYMGEKK